MSGGPRACLDTGTKEEIPVPTRNLNPGVGPAVPMSLLTHFVPSRLIVVWLV